MLSLLNITQIKLWKLQWVNMNPKDFTNRILNSSLPSYASWTHLLKHGDKNLTCLLLDSYMPSIMGGFYLLDWSKLKAAKSLLSFLYFHLKDVQVSSLSSFHTSKFSCILWWITYFLVHHHFSDFWKSSSFYDFDRFWFPFP